MNKTKWVKNPDGSQGYTINPVKGKCPMGCSYCYARRMYDRFKWNPEIKLQSRWWSELDFIKPSRIFVGSTMELFGDWIPEDWLTKILYTCKEFNQHTYIFLTKCPQNLIKWSPFPENCWVGISVTNSHQYQTALQYSRCYDARIKFISFEPLLQHITITSPFEFGYLNWLIIGQQTPASKKTEPKIEWVREIVEAADRARIPVFLKDNLRPLLIPEDCSKPNYLMEDIFWASEKAKLRQEFPK